MMTQPAASNKNIYWYKVFSQAAVGDKKYLPVYDPGS
jgi:hypothetical protein